MKKKIQITLVIVVLAGIFFAAYRFSIKPAAPTAQIDNAPQTVTVQKVGDSNQLSQTITYPASVVGANDIILISKSAGNVSALNFDLGSFVAAGSLLAKIDDTGNILQSSENGFQSAQVQQAQLAKEQAKEALDLAKRNYKNLKNDYDHQQNNVTKTQVDAAKAQIEIAEIQYDSAKVGNRSTQDEHLITSPIAGYVTGKKVSLGDSVSVGQPLVTISKGKNVKIQFFVDQNQLASLKRGAEVAVADGNGNTFPALVRNISPAADPDTKRFLIEAFPKQPATFSPLAGTIVSVSFSFPQKPLQAGNLILPLSAITIGQNESYLFVAENGRAKKIIITIGKVTGETAELKADLDQNAQIILSGSKLLRDGDLINIAS